MLQETALRTLRKACEKEKIYKITMPQIGCGLDKLNWGRVKGLISTILSAPFLVKIYKLTEEELSDSDDEIFETPQPPDKEVACEETPQEQETPQPIQKKELKDKTPRNSVDESEIEEYYSVDNANSGHTDTQETQDETSEDSETDDEIFSNEEGIPRPDRETPYEEVRDRLSMHKGNCVFFITQRGEPVDEGAKDLEKTNKLPEFTHINLARAKVHQAGNRYFIGLPIKEGINTQLDNEVFDETVASLQNVVTELNLVEIGIAKTTRIDSMCWKEIIRKIEIQLVDVRCKVTVYQQLVKIINEQEIPNIIKENHESSIGGHKGVTKTYARIRQRYFWPGMKKQIEDYVRICVKCQTKKLTRVKTRKPMILTDTPDSAFDKISMDIMGPLPLTPQGNEYILTIQDQLTKYSMAVALTNTKSQAIADALITEVINRYGAPRTILTDQGANLTSSLIRQLAKRYRINQVKTTAFHPQSNGSIERSHHVLTEYLKSYINNQNNWDEWLTYAMFSYNTSTHEGTKYTPFELVYGRVARVPSGNEVIEETSDRTYTDYLTELYKKLRESQNLAKENLNAAKSRSKRYYDRKTKNVEFEKGSLVFLLKEPSKGKFDDQYTGPHEVLDTLSNNNVKIRVGTRERIVHYNKLKKAKL